MTTSRNISKQEYAETIDTYISSQIDVFKSDENPYKWEWAFLTDPRFSDQPVSIRFESSEKAMNHAIHYVKANCPGKLEAAKNDAREWMKYNKHKMATKLSA